MKRPPLRRRRGFSILELLVAFSVVAVLTLLLSQVVSWVSQSWTRGQQLKNNLGKGRVAMDLITRDLKLGVFRPDLGAFVDAGGAPSPHGGDYCFFAALTTDGQRGLSLVNFRREDDGTLIRQALPVGWDPAQPPSITFGATRIPEMDRIDSAGTSAELANGVLAFRMYFVNVSADGATRTVEATYANDAAKRSEAIGIGMVVMDERAQRLLENQGKLNTVLNDPRWTPPSDLSKGLRGYWKQQADSFLAGADVPNEVRTGLHVFESVIPLPGNFDR